MRNLNATIEKSLRSGLYTAKINGCIIGDFGTKIGAKRAIKKYIKNNFSEHKQVYSKRYVFQN